MSTMILRILVFFLLCTAFALANTEKICHGGECYPRIFVPTEDFQIVKEGQEIPRGSSPQYFSNIRSSRKDKHASMRLHMARLN